MVTKRQITNIATKLKTYLSDEATFGFNSTHNAIINSGFSKSNIFEDTMNDGLLDKIGKHRITHNKWLRLSAFSRQQLYHLYDYEAQNLMNNNIKDIFGMKGYIALFLVEEKKLIRLCKKIKRKKTNSEENKEIFIIRKQVEEIYIRVHNEWYNNR